MTSKNRENKVGERVKSIRQALKMTQSEFASKLDISTTAMSESEKAKYKPGFEVMMKLMTVYDVNLYYLFFGKGQMFLPGGDAAKGSALLDMTDYTDYELEFLDYFAKSQVVRFRLLGYFQQLMLEEGDLYKREIEELGDA